MKQLVIIGLSLFTAAFFALGQKRQPTPVIHELRPAHIEDRFHHITREFMGGNPEIYMGLTDAKDRYHPVIHDFQKLIEGDPEIYMGFTQMFEQIPNTGKYLLDPSGMAPQIRSYEHMLSHLNRILTTAPAFPQNGTHYGSIPIEVMLQWPMCTTAGFRMFTNAKVNAQLKRILSVWSQFIASPASRYVLTTEEDGGWFSAQAMREIPGFTELFECDPEQEHFGYASLDDYFTRRFRPNMRPVDSPHDNRVITGACESIPFALRQNVQERNTFWIKGDPYSIQHLLYNDPLAFQFVGGTVFQSFLPALYYHRWHSPVDGIVVKIIPVSGTYYAISPTFQFTENKDPDLENNGYSQAFLTNVATRMLIFIQADNPDIGLMAFAAIGMMDVSSCEATVEEGQRVKKGDELGMFHFGGSSYVMVFRSQTKIDFSETVHQGLKDGRTPVYVRSRVGVVQSHS